MQFCAEDILSLPAISDAWVMTPPQIRAARGLLNWTVQELAEKVGLDRNTVAQIESGRYASDAETMAAIRHR